MSFKVRLKMAFAIFATKAIGSPRPIEAKDRRPVKIGARAVDVRAPGIWVPVFVTDPGSWLKGRASRFGKIE